MVIDHIYMVAAGVSRFKFPPVNTKKVSRYKISWANCYRLEPLLARIKEKRTAVVCPMVDAIDAASLEYSNQGGVQVGGFTWSLHFTWENVPKHEQDRRETSFSPTR